jgi:FkbM family methyltransferase
MIKQRFRRAIKAILATTGYTLTQIDPERPTMNRAMQAISDRRHAIETVVDVGASNGQWSEAFMAHYPQARYLLLEAQTVHSRALQQFCQRHPNASYVLAAAGAEKGEIYFDSGHPLGGQASYTPFAADNIVVPVTTVDNEVIGQALPGPYLLKLDTHGFETPILEGAQTTLQQTEVIVIECYNFKIAPESVLFHEMICQFEEMGFRCIDLVDIMYRPYDNALWQMDLVFIRADRPEFTYTRYR